MARIGVGYYRTHVQTLPLWSAGEIEEPTVYQVRIFSHVKLFVDQNVVGVAVA